jgi:hypothetical protein
MGRLTAHASPSSSPVVFECLRKPWLVGSGVLDMVLERMSQEEWGSIVVDLCGADDELREAKWNGLSRAHQERMAFRALSKTVLLSSYVEYVPLRAWGNIHLQCFLDFIPQVRVPYGVCCDCGGAQVFAQFETD